jgi:hypothetical protein
MDSSIEIWDAKTLKHIDSIPLGEAYGSSTWIDRYDGTWWICYAHFVVFLVKTDGLFSFYGLPPVSVC